MTTGQIRSSERTVFFVDRYSGDIMVAPDTKMKPFDGWTRVECSTVAETEAMSRRMAMQEFAKMRSMRVEEHLRTKARRDSIIANCRLRLAKGCVSEADEAANRLIISRLERADERLYKLLGSEPDLSRAHLAIEAYDAETIRANANGKYRGLKDDDVNIIGALTEGVR